MSTRGEELNTRLTATDEASRVLDNVAAEMADLEDRPHDIDLGADASDAEEEISQLDRRLRGLTDAEKRVVLNVAAKDAQRDLDRLNRDLARAEKYDDEEIAIRVEAKGNAERRLDAIQSEIRDIDGATPDIRPEVDSSEVDSLIDKLDELTGGRTGGLGVLRGRSGAGIGAAIATGLVLAGDAAANAAVEVDSLAKLTGDNVETASRLSGVWKTTGADAKDLQDILLQMGDVLANDAELAARIGVNLDDGRPLGERFIDVVDLLTEKFENAGERSLIAAQLFGEEGVRQVNEVTAAYGDLSKAVDDYGGSVFTDSEIEKAREYKHELAELKTEFGAFAVEVGTFVLPALGLLTDGLSFTNDSIERVGTSIGQNLRHIFDGGEAHANRQYVEAFEASENAAREFDRALLDNAETTDDVRRIVKDYGLDLHAQNLLVVEWANAHRDGATAADELGAAAENAGAKAKSSRSEIDNVGTGVGGLRTELDQEAPAGLFGSIIEQAGEAESAVDNVTSGMDGLLGRISEKGAIDDIANQWDRVGEAFGKLVQARDAEGRDGEREERAYRSELERLASAVLGFAGEVEDIPDEKLVKLLTAIDTENFEQVRRELDILFEDRTIGINVSGGYRTNWKLDDDGRPVPVDQDWTGAQTFDNRPAPVINNTYYQISPTPAQIGTGGRDDELWNAPRPR